MAFEVHQAAGFILAIASAVCNGSFAAAQKAPPVQRAAPHPIIFNSFVGLGVVVSSICVMPFLHLLEADLKFNPLGSLSGMLFVGATLFSFLAIPRLGLAIAQGTWGGAALLTAFLWGVLGPEPVGKEPKSWPGSLGGVLLLVTGILGMVFHAEIARVTCGKQNTDREASLLDDGPPQDLELKSTTDEQEREGKRGPGFVLGIVFAISVGLFGGSVNVPSAMTAKSGVELKGVETLPSFGIGTLIAGLLVPVIYFKVIDRQAELGLDFRALTLPGILSGTIWNLGNLCSVYANDGISFAVAQPMMQCALLVSGMLGIFVFKEIRGGANILTFFVFAAVLLGGAAVLAVYGPSAGSPAPTPSPNATHSPSNATHT